MSAARHARSITRYILSMRFMMVCVVCVSAGSVVEPRQHRRYRWTVLRDRFGLVGLGVEVREVGMSDRAQHGEHVFLDAVVVAVRGESLDDGVGV